MFATSSPAVLIFCSLWCLVLPCVAVPSLVSNQERHKAAKLPDYKDAEGINPHQYCLGQVDHFVHSWKLKNYRKRQFQVGQIRSAGTVFQSLLLLLLYGGLCVVCNVGAVVGLGVDCMTASEQFDQFGSPFFPVKRLVLLFVITCILSLQLWTMRAFPTRSSGKATNRNCRKKYRQRAGILSFTNCFCMHELLLIMCGDVELNPGPQGQIESTTTTTIGPLDTETAQESTAPLVRRSENNAIETTADNIPTVPEDRPVFTGLEPSMDNLHLETGPVENKTAHRKFDPIVTLHEPRVDPGDEVVPKPFNQQHNLSQKVLEDDSDSLDPSNYTKESPVNGDTSRDELAAETVVEKHWERMKEMFPEKSKFKRSNPTEAFNILRNANENFRKDKQDDPPCIRCGQEKPKPTEGGILSHIFPESMLKLVRKVHCENERRFINDLSTCTHTYRHMQASDYAYYLQCSACEKLYNDPESHLKNVYLLLIANREEVKTSVAYEKVGKIVTDKMRAIITEIVKAKVTEEEVKAMVAKVTKAIVANEQMRATIAKVVRAMVTSAEARAMNPNNEEVRVIAATFNTEAVTSMVATAAERAAMVAEEEKVKAIVDKITRALGTEIVRIMVGNQEIFAKLTRAMVTEVQSAMVTDEVKKAIVAEVQSAMVAEEEQLTAMVTEEVRAIVANKVRATDPSTSIKERWLPYALVNIMYRGVLVCASIDRILDLYQEKFIKLWENALGYGTTTEVRLYILPNRPFITNNVHFMNVIEVLLRNPTPTKLYTCTCKSKDAGDFLYTIFDCFYLVLPLCTTSKGYFDRYTSVNITDDEVYLKRCQYKTHVTGNCASSLYFPPVLHGVCMDSFNSWVQKLAKTDDPLKSTKLNQSLILAEMYPEKDPDPESEDPRPSIQEQQTSNECVYYSPDGAATDDAREYTKQKVIKNEAKLIKDATELSIFGELQQLRLEVKNIKEKVENDKKQFKEELKSLIEKNENLELTNKTIAKAYDIADEQNKKLTLEKEEVDLLKVKITKLEQDVSEKEEIIVQYEEVVSNLRKRIAEQN